jgi:hypothetical protein
MALGPKTQTITHQLTTVGTEPPYGEKREHVRPSRPGAPSHLILKIPRYGMIYTMDVSGYK